MKLIHTKLSTLAVAGAMVMLSLTSCDDAAFNQSFSMDGQDLMFAVKPDPDNGDLTVFGGNDIIANTTLKEAATKSGFDMNKVQSVKLKTLDCNVEDSIGAADPNIEEFKISEVDNLLVNVLKVGAPISEAIVLTKTGYTVANGVMRPNLNDVELKELITGEEDLDVIWNLTLKNPIDHAFKIRAKMGYTLTVQVGG